MNDDTEALMGVTGDILLHGRLASVRPALLPKEDRPEYTKQQIMDGLERGYDAAPPGMRGGPRPAKLRMGRRAPAHVPCAMQKQACVSIEEQRNLFRERKADPKCKDVVKGSEGDSFYVAWNAVLG